MISRRALFGLLMAVAALWCFSEWRYSAGESFGEKTKDVEWQSRWDARDAADAEELKLRQDAARQEERRRTDAVAAMQKEANDELDQANRAAADAAAKSLGLQQQLKELRTKLAAGGSCQISGSSGAGKAEAAITVLSELLSEADGVAGEMAAEADRARIAGSTCERMYVGITGGSQ